MVFQLPQIQFKTWAKGITNPHVQPILIENGFLGDYWDCKEQYND